MEKSILLNGLVNIFLRRIADDKRGMVDHQNALQKKSSKGRVFATERILTRILHLYTEKSSIQNQRWKRRGGLCFCGEIGRIRILKVIFKAGNDIFRGETEIPNQAYSGRNA